MFSICSTCTWMSHRFVFSIQGCRWLLIGRLHSPPIPVRDSCHHRGVITRLYSVIWSRASAEKWCMAGQRKGDSVICTTLRAVFRRSIMEPSRPSPPSAPRQAFRAEPRRSRSQHQRESRFSACVCMCDSLNCEALRRIKKTREKFSYACKKGHRRLGFNRWQMRETDPVQVPK